MRTSIRTAARILTRQAAICAAMAVVLLCGPGARAQQATPASAQAGLATKAAGVSFVPTFYEQPPTPTPEQLAAALSGLARSHRSGPTDLPRAAQQATGGPGAGVSITAEAATDLVTGNVAPTIPNAMYSAVGEPSGDNAGVDRLQVGNWYAALSANGGGTWFFVNPFTIFGSGFCCDQVLIYDPGRNAWFWLLQYGDGHLVLANSTDLQHVCSYNWTPANIGQTGQFDFNELALTTNDIYIVSNFFPSSGGSGSAVLRLPIDPQLSCSSFNFGFFARTDLGFSWRPVSNGGDTLYWGTDGFGTAGSSFRVFKWPEGSDTIVWQDSTLGTTFNYFTRSSGQNCGSADGKVSNWCAFGDSRVLGAALYSAPDGSREIVFSLNAGQGGPFSLPFPYSEREHFNESDMTYKSSDRLYSTQFAIQYMSLANNARGHIGSTAIFGGGCGGCSDFFPSVMVNLQDDVSPTQPWASAFPAFGAGNTCTVSMVPRSGDFTTTRPFRPVGTAFLAYNFVLNANAGSCGSTAPVQTYETFFARSRDVPGANRWK